MTDWCTQRLVVQHDTGQPAIQFESMVGDGRHPGLKCPTNNCWRKMHKSSSERRTDGNDDGETTPHSRVMYCAVQYWRNLERIIGTVLEDFYSTVHSSRGNPRCKTRVRGPKGAWIILAYVSHPFRPPFVRNSRPCDMLVLSCTPRTRHHQNNEIPICPTARKRTSRYRKGWPPGFPFRLEKMERSPKSGSSRQLKTMVSWNGSYSITFLISYIH